MIPGILLRWLTGKYLMIAASVICSIYTNMRAFTKQGHSEVKTVFPSHYVKSGMKLIS